MHFSSNFIHLWIAFPSPHPPAADRERSAISSLTQSLPLQMRQINVLPSASWENISCSIYPVSYISHLVGTCGFDKIHGASNMLLRFLTSMRKIFPTHLFGLGLKPWSQGCKDNVPTHCFWLNTKILQKIYILQLFYPALPQLVCQVFVPDQSSRMYPASHFPQPVNKLTQNVAVCSRLPEIYYLRVW